MFVVQLVPSFDLEFDVFICVCDFRENNKGNLDVSHQTESENWLCY